MLLPLSDLRDPFAFLQGARVPLASRPRRQIEWIVDDAFYRINDSFERDSLRRWLDEDEERPTGIDEDRARTLSLDLADPDVARWVDWKIAEAVWTENSPFGPPPTQAAIRCGVESDWASTPCFFMATIGCEDGHTLRHPTLTGIPCDDANIPAARAALTRALFGKVSA